MNYRMLFLLVAMLPACANRQGQLPLIDDVIVKDRTEPHKLVPMARAHIQALHLGENKGQEITLRYVEVLDQKTTPILVMHLPNAATTALQNNRNIPFYQERLTLQFIDTLQKLLPNENLIEENSPLGYSEIFATVAKQLGGLAKRPARYKHLYLYSDLKERSTLFDSYLNGNQELLAHHVDRVVALFKSQGLLPKSLSGITLYLIYEPRSRDDDIVYSRMENVYRRLLEPLGAKIIQQAQNKSFDDVE